MDHTTTENPLSEQSRAIAKVLIERGTKSSSGLVLILDEYTIAAVIGKYLVEREPK
jgi:hypothetical protein